MDLLKDTINSQYGQKIRVRVCGVLVTGKGILLAGLQGLTDAGTFWIPPGGGLEFGESLTQALKREFLEETGLTVEVHELLRLHQHISLPLHAVELFFRVSKTGGEVKTGADPEHTHDQQLLQQVGFFTHEELQQLPHLQMHPILQNLGNFEELLQPDLGLSD